MQHEDRQRDEAGARSVAPALAIASILALNACGTTHALLSPEFEDDLLHIDGVSLEEESQSAPLTIEHVEEAARRDYGAAEAHPESIHLTIDDIRRATLENNLDLIIERISPSIAEEEAREEQARFEGTAFGSTTAVHSDPPAIVVGSATLEGTTQAHEIGVRFPLRTGALLTLSMPVNTQRTQIAGTPKTYESDARISLSQPVLRDAGIGVNTAPITIARLRHRQQEARTKLAAIRILAEAEGAHWDHYTAARELDVRHQQYRLAARQLQQARRLAELGAVPRLEVERSEAGLARRVENIIVAETRRRATERNLKRIMNVSGRGIESPVALIPSAELRPLRLDLDAVALAQKAVATRMEMVELELQLAVDAIGIDVERNGTLPLLNLGLDFSMRGAGNTFQRSVDALSQHDNDWQATAQIEIPLGNRAARSRLRKARLQRVLTLSSRRQRRLAIELQVHDAVDQLEQHWQSILAARHETLTAERIYGAEQRQFRAGARTSTEVLEAADFLADAQIREIRAMAGYEIAKLEIAVATGTLLGHARIRLEPYAP